MTPDWWRHVRHFEPHEFDSPDVPGSGATGMRPQFVFTLDRVRQLVNRPLVVTSGFRTAAHNVAVAGSPNSAHLRGWAADLLATTHRERFWIVRAALTCGVERLGVYPRHVHLDTDPTLPRELIWLA